MKTHSLTCLALLLSLFVGCSTKTDLDRPMELPFDSTVVVAGTEKVCPFAVKELNEIVKLAAGREYMVERWKGGEVEKWKGGEVEKWKGGESRWTKDGSSLEGNSNTQTLKNSNTTHRIFIGRSPESESLLGSAFFDSLKDEESVVTSRGDDLFLVGGGSLGTLYAVYDFVEDNLGYRWYWMRADGEKIDKTDTVVWKGKSTRRRPAFTDCRGLHNWHPGSYLFMVRNRSNQDIEEVAKEVPYKFAHRIPGHGFDFYLPRKGLFPPQMAPTGIETNMFAKHPEYFSLDENGKRRDDMQVCLSNPDARREMIKNFMLWVGKYGHGVYQVGQNDEHTGRFCCCPNCIALEKKYNSNGGPLWDFVLELCGELKRRGRDDVYVTSLAYRGQTQLCPDNIEFPENFIADCAPLTWDRSLKDMPDEALPDGRIYNYYENIAKWCRTAKHVSYWFYQLPSPMFINGRAFRELNELWEAGVKGVGSCGCSGGAYEFHDLSMYLFLKFLREPTADMRAELKEALDFRYGPAADEMLAYIDILDAARESLAKTNPSLQNDGADPYISMGFLSSDDIVRIERLFDRATAEVAGTKYAEPVRFARVGIDFTLFFKAARVKAQRPDYAFDVGAVEERCRAAANDFWKDPKNHYITGGTPHRHARNTAANALEDYANYKLLKSEALPPELAKYPARAVTRILPPKSRPMKRWWKPMGSDLPDTFYTSVEDPAAVSGWAISDKIPSNMTSVLSFGIYDWPQRKYLRPLQQVPTSFWEKDRYKLFCIGRSKYANDTRCYVSDSALHTDLASSPLYSKLLARCFDGVYREKIFETWISVKAQGPKFIPGDTRENRLFIEQFFVVDLAAAGEGK